MTNNSNRKLKAISFSLDDEFENGLLEYVEAIKNFSGYVKRLINDDMRGYKRVIVSHELNNSITVEDYSNEDKEAMSSFF